MGKSSGFIIMTTVLENVAGGFGLTLVREAQLDEWYGGELAAQESFVDDDSFFQLVQSSGQYPQAPVVPSSPPAREEGFVMFPKPEFRLPWDRD